MSAITPEIVAEHGLSEDEYKMVLEIMGREPNINELGIFSVMWSEHCSYKSSKKWLKTLPTKAPWVICGPGENAGIIDIGDDDAIIFKMESHNHPSYIEPYQGAATGVGGIMRDVFTMGARPIANLNALRFGVPEHPKTRHLVHGVVEGIGGYGNCMGVPTVGGEVEFDASYDGNILVNAMCVGLADAKNIFYCAAAGIGNPVVYVGSKTGRDGIHGATMASTEFTADTEEKRPTVQVGDPFTEKLLLEACLELMQTDAIVAIQDMGAAGLTSSSFEMASSGGVGIDMNLDNVPQREENMTPYEMMLSESQERMLMVLKPGKEEMAKAIFEKWELDFSIIGTITNTGRMRLFHGGEVVADLPINPLAQASPEYDRPYVPTPKRAPLAPGDVKAPADCMATIKALVSSPNGCSKRWVWEQYDHMVMGDTTGLGRPGGDAAMVRIHGSQKAIAMSSDVTPRYVFADPVEGGRQAVAETYRNISATGALPMAITDNMNFGNPQRPEIMGQFVGAVQGIGEACIALDYPVVSGNVSLYNETNGQGILPTPTIGGVGVIQDVSKAVGMGFVAQGEAIVLIGATAGHLGCSQYLAEIEGRKDGPAPHVDLVAERKNGDFVRGQILAGAITACHDLSSGGLGVGLAEMAMKSGLGADVEDQSGELPLHAWLFGEDQARYLATTKDAGALLAAAKAAGVVASQIGIVDGKDLTIAGAGTISVSKLSDAHEKWMPDYMAHPDFEVG
ncbi:phosphoribosylformylglycinamidine synthase subunit PurL [Magnetovibrio blakemorei]|uniref:Phosphoribosylformylglycinamidine synthase subunit PurL n=1 Tax=Magnetovibrio blakemorei TaxID=28181 RepID=A0A1E5Q8C8_9PROT|nr:phosphoribosylformylglycinamidine synthase subunit PurL [Magnetovibrio blakemorei]OEJ67506.1 phosphoribosylformylglycinamidine synthase II [Magnetovibrio blakemorei]